MCTFCQPQASETHPSCALLSKPQSKPPRQQGEAVAAVLPAWGQAAGRRRGDPPVVREAPGSLSAGPWAEDSSHPQVQRWPAELPRELQCHAWRDAWPGQAVCTLWDHAQRETSQTRNSLSDLIWLPLYSKHVGLMLKLCCSG